MHLANPPATLEDAIAQLTERTHQLDCARHDNAKLHAAFDEGVMRTLQLEAENAKLREENEKTAAALWNANLRLGYVERAAQAVVRTARKASREQDLVHRPVLLELAREVGEPLHTTI